MTWNPLDETQSTALLTFIDAADTIIGRLRVNADAANALADLVSRGALRASPLYGRMRELHTIAGHLATARDGLNAITEILRKPVMAAATERLARYRPPPTGTGP